MLVVAVAACVGGPATAASSADGTQTGAAPAWTVSVGPAGAVGRPVVYDGRAFTVDGTLVTAVDLADGGVVWQDDDSMGLTPMLGLPSLVDGQIDVPWAWAEQRGIFAHDPETGAAVNGPGSYVLGHIVTRGTHHASLDETFLGMEGLSFISLDYGRFERSGLIAINDFAEPEPYSDPVIVGDHVWVGYGGSLMRFDRRGRCMPIPQVPGFCGPNATADIIGNIVGLAAGPNGTIVSTTDDGVLQVFDGATGVELWRATLGPGVTAPTVRAGLITLGYSNDATRTGALLAYPATGCGASECLYPSWKVDVNSPIVGAPSVGGGFVVVGTHNGKIVAVSIAACAAGTCQPIPLGHVASQITGGPLVGDSTAVVATANGDLTGFREP